LQDLDEAVRRYLAWDSILAEETTLNLDPHQKKQAEGQKTSADTTVNARLPEAYQWLLVPTQKTPQATVEWQAIRLTGQDPLAVRASKKLRNDELLIASYAPSCLRMELDRVPLWRGDHVTVKQLTEDFARYLYLPRLKNPEVLLSAIVDGLRLTTWQQDSFAFADSYDESTRRYRSLQCRSTRKLADANTPGLLVKPEAAVRQIEADKTPAPVLIEGPGSGDTAAEPPLLPPPPPPSKPKRFHGSVALDAARVSRDAGTIAENIISHLSGLVGANVKVTLDIEAEVPSGVPDNVVRIVTENGRTLKFTTHGFEEE
jgi:hypothetical protein